MYEPQRPPASVFLLLLIIPGVVLGQSDIPIPDRPFDQDFHVSHAPVVVGLLADRIGLSRSVALTAFSYLAASILLSIGAFRFAPRDTQRMEALLRSEVLDPI